MEQPVDRKVIVVVEDNQEIAELIKEALNEEPDYQAVAVYDGARALDVIHSVKARLIILDVMLPGLDGLQLFDMLKADPTTLEIPVLFVTATEHDHEFKKRSIADYIRKPFDLADLLTRVATTLESGSESSAAEGESPPK